MTKQWDALVKVACSNFGITISNFYGHRRKQKYVACRAYVVYYFRKVYPFVTYQQIGIWLYRHHTTIMNLFQQYQNGVYGRVLER